MWETEGSTTASIADVRKIVREELDKMFPFEDVICEDCKGRGWNQSNTTLNPMERPYVYDCETCGKSGKVKRRKIMLNQYYRDIGGDLTLAAVRGEETSK